MKKVEGKPALAPAANLPATLAAYYEKYGSRITQASERLFVDEFLHPLVGTRISEIEPQHTFIDRTGRCRRIDFSHHGPTAKIALEVNGETYHAEGIIPNEQFDDNLFRQNEILRKGYHLVRFSYQQLQSPQWRPVIMDSLRGFLADFAPHLLCEYSLKPTEIQREALEALEHSRSKREWGKAVVVMPTGTGKTILSALDARRHGGRVLFLVHRLDILTQSLEAYKKVWGKLNEGFLTGVERYNEEKCDVLFSSKDTLRQPAELARFSEDWFDYIVIDEVHHGQSPSYQPILKHFRPRFILGMTATPDRTDRKDIFELFDYNKAYEISLQEVIDRGLLVPFTYFGLTDNIDYSRIRYQNQRYRVDDLERFLIIPERNEAVLKAYLAADKGRGDKGIGFCVSIKHADRMAEFFNAQGVKAAAIHSESADRDKLIQQFRADDLQVVFTVDLFNEGIDFPNVRVLLFLRPTESKTVFLQQLGRGLRLSAGKDRVRVLDFIGNYKRANQIRKYLAKQSHPGEDTENGRRKKKVVYEYSLGCEVHFDEKVEELLNRQDVEELGVDKEDLKAAYFTLAEKLGRKPTKEDLDSEGQYPSRQYVQMWESWRSFLQEVGEYTEASYHYPQGTHLGHILSILWYFGLAHRKGTHVDDKFIRLGGGLDEGRIGIYQRQLKYKLQAAMELGILEDYRACSNPETYAAALSIEGRSLREVLKRDLSARDLKFPLDSDGVPSSRMAEDEDAYNSVLLKAIGRSAEARASIYKVFLGMHAVQQMLAFLYHIIRAPQVSKERVYSEFFEAPFVKRYCEQEGIEEATLEAAKRRCPFLLNVLAACGIVELSRSDVTVKRLVLLPSLVRPHAHEDQAVSLKRLHAIEKAWPKTDAAMIGEDLSIVRELFGPEFLTERYRQTDLEVVEV